MSLDTWKAEFYPVEAEKVKKRDALAHSLQKWLGLRPGNLWKHKVWRPGSAIRIEDCYAELWIGGDTCALCAHYLNTKCPLGNCTDDFGCRAPYDA